MPHLLQLARPVARLSSSTLLRPLTTHATQQTTSKRLDIPAPSKPASRKTPGPKPYPSEPAIPTLENGPLPPPTKTITDLLAAGTPYLVRRTPGAQLPVYRRWRGGGTLEEVLIKKIEGDRKKFVEDLRAVLGCDPAHVRINPTTTHVEIKGDHWLRTRSWLAHLGF